jgi:hypothetical protein
MDILVSPGSFGMQVVELSEFDPAHPDRIFMTSASLEVPDAGPFEGLGIGDLVEIATARGCPR